MKSTIRRTMRGGVILSLVVMVLPILPVRADEQAAIDYLQTAAKDDWTVQALVTTQETAVDQSFLDNFTDTGTTAIEKRILTLAALDLDPESYYPNRNLIQELTQDHYADGQLGDMQFINDDFWGVLALASANKTNSLVFTDSVDFIITNQNIDGGWSFQVGEDSDTNDTAIAVMALLEAGYTASSQEIMDAVSYLQSAQNTDGGWGFVAGSDSDAASTAWVIAALTKTGETVEQDVIDFLWSLQTANGSFKWVLSDTEGTAYMTAQSLIALSGRYFPVKKYSGKTTSHETHLRIEGGSNTYCDEGIAATTALEIVEQGARVCNYTYNIEQASFGSYLNQINNDTAEGTKGWMYRVNWEQPNVGAADYILEQGDYVLWYYGEFTLQPLRLSVSTAHVEVGDEVVVEVERYSDADRTWSPAVAAKVMSAGQEYTTDSAGRVTITMDQAGVQQLFATKTDYIRSNSIDVTVGNGVTQTIGWEVTVGNSSGGGNPEVSFSVANSQLDFGKVNKGDEVERSVVLTNDGTVDIYIEAIVSGDPELVNVFKLNSTHWQDYNQIITVQDTESVKATLMVPNTYTGSGKQVGDIVFWGAAAN